MKWDKYNSTTISKIKKPKDIFKTREWHIVRFSLLSNFKECLKCKSTKNLQIDHIEPISKNPKQAINYMNLQVLCEFCNKEKSNKHCKDYRDYDDYMSTKDIFDYYRLHKFQARYKKAFKKMRNIHKV